MKKMRTKKKDSVADSPNDKHEGARVQLETSDLNTITVTALQMTPEQERQWASALDLLLDAMVRQQLEGEDNSQ